MSVKTTVILFLLVLGFGGFILLVEPRLRTTPQKEVEKSRVLKMNAREVEYLRVDRSGNRIECLRRGTDWFLKRPEGALVNPASIHPLLAYLERMEKRLVIPESEIRSKGKGLKSYGLDQPEIRLSFGTDLIEHTLLIGRRTPAGDTLYLKHKTEPLVYVVSAQLLDLLPKGVADLRDRGVFAGRSPTVQKLEMQRAEGFLQFEHDPDGPWRMMQPVAHVADQEKVDALVSRLMALRIEEFMPDGSELRPEYGFSDTAPFVKLWFANDEVPAKLILGNPVEGKDGLLYARLDGMDSVFGISRGMESLVASPVFDLLDSRLVTLDPEAMLGLRIERGESVIRMLREEDGWAMQEPVRCAADAQLMQYLIEDWLEARVMDWKTAAEAAGLYATNTPPHYTVAFITSTNAPPEGATATPHELGFEFHPLADEPGRFLFHQQPQDIWGVVGAELFRLLHDNPLHYRDRTILELEVSDVLKVKQVDGELSCTASRKSATEPWRPVEEGMQLDTMRIDELLAQCGNLEVRAFVESDPKDLGKYGLDTPQLKISFGLSGKTGIGKTLLIGSESANGDRFGMLLGQDLVFQLRKETLPFFMRPLCNLNREEALGPGAGATP